ncbi:hypothetical protein [Pedobacter xixiisoli]|nr:hypothetical protein [Pedobacter xixiisoli]
MNGRSKRTLLVSLSLFVAFSTLYNGWILIGSPTQREIRFGNIHVPQKAGQSKIIHDAYSMELQRIRTFRKYMDSLYSSETGRPTYDSIMEARPGLLDSVKALEKLVGK